jgi:hypothetical protein
MTFNTLNQLIDQNSQNSVNFPADTDILFSNHKNVHKPRVEKRQRKLLQKITFLPSFLQQDERVLQVTTGCSPVSFGEQFLTGAIVFVIKRSLFVFTDRRVFHIRTKSDFSYRGSIAQILYADCQRIFVKGRTLIAEYKNGTKERFTCIAGREKTKIKALLKSIPLDGPQSHTQQRTHLCPRCTNPLIEDSFTCPSCSLPFKDKARARKLSIIFPGGGYFYTGHRYFGIVDALVETYLLLLLLFSLIGAIAGAPGGFFVSFFFTAILTIEKSITIYHANRYVEEYIPVQRDVQPDKACAPQTSHSAQHSDALTAQPADDQQAPEEVLSTR